MPDINQFKEVAENVAYRFEDRRYSHSDEWGEHLSTTHGVRLLVFPIIKYTPCGMWIGLCYSEYPYQPSPWQEPNGSDEFHFGLGEKRFVNLQATKRFALPNVSDAYESYLARKDRQILVYTARIKGAEAHKRAAESVFNSLPEGLKVG